MPKRGLTNERIEELIWYLSDGKEVVSEIDDHVSENKLCFENEEGEESNQDLRFYLANTVKFKTNNSTFMWSIFPTLVNIIQNSNIKGKEVFGDI